MTCCLVSAATVNEFSDAATIARRARYPPLGVLTLASVLRRAGIEPSFVDLDELYRGWVEGRRARPARDFASMAAEAIAATGAEVVGFSSICSSYPLTLRVAQEVRRVVPRARLLLGGPQASTVAEATLRAFPAVDLVVRGEADGTLPLVVHALRAGGDLGRLPGVTSRAGAGIVSSPDAPVVEDLDALPPPAFDLYGHMGELTSIPIEAGRGCPFRCTFCATSHFFRRRFRLKSAALLVSQMLELSKAHGLRTFSLIHDNFTVDRRRLLQFCAAMAARGQGLTWGCSARTDCLDPEAIARMAAAGCSGVFLGVESGSRRVRAQIGKDLDLAHATRCLREADRHGVKVSLALMTGFPEERLRDVRQTASYFARALRFDHVDPQLSLLAPLPGTRVHALWREQLAFGEIVSDLAFQGWEMDRRDRDLVRAHPEVFSSFYTIPTAVDRSYLFDLRRFLLWAGEHYRWELLALQRLTGDALTAFELWRSWLGSRRRARRGPVRPGRLEYRRFRHDFLEFVASVGRRYRGGAPILRALVAHERSMQRRPPNPPRPAPARPRRLRPSSRVVLSPDLVLSAVPCDYAELLRRLRAGAPLSGMPRRSTLIVTRFTEARREIVGVSPLAGEILQLCRRPRSLRSLLSRFALAHPTVSGLDGGAACAAGVRRLMEQGLLRSGGGRTH